MASGNAMLGYLTVKKKKKQWVIVLEISQKIYKKILPWISPFLLPMCSAYFHSLSSSLNSSEGFLPFSISLSFLYIYNTYMHFSRLLFISYLSNYGLMAITTFTVFQILFQFFILF